MSSASHLKQIIALSVQPLSTAVGCVTPEFSQMCSNCFTHTEPSLLFHSKAGAVQQMLHSITFFDKTLHGNCSVLWHNLSVAQQYNTVVAAM